MSNDDRNPVSPNLTFINRNVPSNLPIVSPSTPGFEVAQEEIMNYLNADVSVESNYINGMQQLNTDEVLEWVVQEQNNNMHTNNNIPNNPDNNTDELSPSSSNQDVQMFNKVPTGHHHHLIEKESEDVINTWVRILARN
uniref:Uncharacterized protein n=1 Tax=Acrobeloides nanus TaxID=290746 RepID=A0A914CFY6_9BILA